MSLHKYLPAYSFNYTILRDKILMKNAELEGLIRQSTKLQLMLFRGIALFLWFGAVLVGLLVLFAPFEAGEEDARLFVMGFGVLFVLVGAYCWYLGKTMPEKVIRLLSDHPQDITEAQHIQVRKNGIVAHAVHFKTAKNKKVGLNVSSANVAERILQLISQELPHVKIG